MDPSLLLKHAGFLRAIARGLVADEDRVEDILQQTWLTAVERPPRSKDSLRSWLAQVAANLARKGIRDDSRRDRREARAARPEALPDPRIAAVIAEAKNQTIQRVVSAVFALEEPYRTVLLLRYYDDLSVADIAARLGVPHETVRTRMRRALQCVRARLDREHGGSRTTWAVALAPLIRSGSEASTPTGAAGLPEVEASVTPASTLLRRRPPGLQRLTLLGIALGLAVVATTLIWQARSKATESARTLGSAPSGPRPGPDSTPSADAAAPAGATHSEADRRTPEAPASPGDSPARLEATGSLHFRLRHAQDGSPASAVKVRVVPEVGLPREPRNDLLDVTTDADGSVRVEGLTPGRYAVLIDRAVTHGFFEIVAGQASEVTLNLPAGIDLDGRVVSQSGAPVPDAEIVLCWPNAEDSGAVVSRSDAYGSYRVRSIGIAALCGARADGHAPSLLHAIDMGFVGSVRKTLVLGPPGGSVAGHVLDAEGQPLAGAAVIVGDRFADELRDRSDGEIVTEARACRLRTDALGRFRTSGLAAGPTQLIVSAADHAAKRQEIVVEPRSATAIVVRLSRGATVSGFVRDDAGRPAPEARVTVDAEPFAAAGIVPATASAGDGSFRIDHVFSGPVRLSARGVGETGAATETRFIRDHDEVVRWDAALSRGLEIRGRLTEEGGASLSGFEVVLASPNPATRLKPREEPRLKRRSVTSDGDGRFAFANCDDRTYMLEIFEVQSWLRRAILTIRGLRPSAQERHVPIAAALRSSAFVRGRLEKPAGAPPSGSIVRLAWATGIAGEPRDVSAAEDGSFSLGPFPPGRYDLQARTSDTLTVLFRDREIAASEDVDLGAIELQAAGTLAATFSRDDGQALGEPVVTVHDSLGHALQQARLVGDRIRAHALPPGAYALGVSEGHGGRIACREFPFEIQSGRTTELRLTLGGGVPVDIRFLQPQGEEWASWVTTTVRDASGRPVHHVILGRSNGDWLGGWTSLSPGRYTVDAASDAGTSATSVIDVSSDASTAQVFEITLRP